jgi:vacuolar-type H+-ATPase subunit C/Vma6
MKVQAVKDFYDIEAKANRAKGEKFDVTEERFESLNSTKYGELAKEVKEKASKTGKGKADDANNEGENQEPNAGSEGKSGEEE